MNSIDTLQKTKFSGRRFTRKQLLQVKETLESFQNLSRKELAFTICEHFDWKTPKGGLKIQSGLKLLEDLESYGVITLPAKKERKQAVQREPAFDTPADIRPINGSLDSIGPISLKLVTSKQDRETWKAYLQHFYYLGYKHPFGSHLGYFIVSESRQQILGCLLFSASAAWALAPRDQFIDWEKKHREKLLHLIISNDRLLIFPWIKVANLASKALSLATKQIGKDWLNNFGYRPVMIETFVDTTKYTGACYRAANFQHVGKTKGRSRFVKNENSKTIKDIYIYPLESDWRHTLTNCHPTKILEKKYRNDVQSSHTHVIDDAFVQVWQKVVIEDFHSKSARGVKQEIFAHFALITMNRIFANQADSNLNQSDNQMSSPDDGFNSDWAKCKINFKNCTHVFSRSLEELVLLQSKINSVVERVYQFVIGRHQKQRPGRSYERKSMKPISKFQKKSKALKSSPATA